MFSLSVSTLLFATLILFYHVKPRFHVNDLLRNRIREKRIIHIFHPCYHPKIIEHILKNKQKKKHVFIHEITRLIIMKMKMKMKNEQITQIKQKIPRSRYGHKYSRYKKMSHKQSSGGAVKKVLLEISQNSQENTCVRDSFLIKLPVACNFIKKRISGTGVFL